MENPWNIDSIYDLQFFNCPSCFFKDSSKQEIINHAFEIHPDSINCLAKIKDESLSDIIWPWNFQEMVKKEETDDGVDPSMIEVHIKTEDDSTDLELPLDDSFSLSIDSNFGENQNKSESKSKVRSDIPSNISFEPIYMNCKECGESLEISEFQKHIRKQEICEKQYSVSDINAIKKQVSERKNKKYYQTNKQKIREKHKIYNQTNKEFMKQYYQLNKEKLKERSKLNYKKVKESGKNPICDLCGKVFSTFGNLKIHKSVHEGTKKSICSHCGKVFNQPAHLSRHIKNVHEGLKDYKCEKCGKEFGELGTLKKTCQ